MLINEFLPTFVSMKKTLIILLTLIIISCGPNDKKDQAEEKKTESVKYSVDPKNVEFKWIAYKTSDKIPVPGTFDKIEINVAQGVDIPSLLLTTSFKIDGTTINSGNPERDEKLRKFFVANWSDSLISGTIETVTGNNKEGQGKFKLEWNGLVNNLSFTYIVNNDTIQIISEISMKDWNAGDAAKALNEACKNVHIGSDGKSVLWDIVMIRIKAPLQKISSEQQNLKEGTEAVKTIMK